MKLDKDALLWAQVFGGGGGITPTGNQDITTLDEYDVSTKATARVSAEERAKIIPENIKQGETILGVEGSYSGGGASVPPNDVNFYDYDGTLVASYAAANFANLSAMPDNPTHEGLTAQGWNWSLADAKTYVASYGKLEIGQMYITDDGSSRFYIEITVANMTVPIYWNQNVANGVTINWGDGSATETAEGAGYKSATHTYAAAGDYVISLLPADNCTMYFGNTTTTGSIFGSYASNDGYRNMLTKCELGKNVKTFYQYAFKSSSLKTITIPKLTSPSFSSGPFINCHSLVYITIPEGVTALGTYAFEYCYSLRNISMPKGLTTVSNSTFEDCGSLQTVTFPSSVSAIGSRVLGNCRALKTIIIPQSITIDSSFAFYCFNLESITIPSGVTINGASAFDSDYTLKTVNIGNSLTAVGSRMFYKCVSLNSITIPSTVTQLDATAFNECAGLQKAVMLGDITTVASSVFNGCYGLQLVDFTACTAVPTLQNTNAFAGTPNTCKILVPAALCDEWKAASNWSTYASKIVAA